MHSFRTYALIRSYDCTVAPHIPLACFVPFQHPDACIYLCVYYKYAAVAAYGKSGLVAVAASADPVMLARQFECELVRFMNTAIDTALTQTRFDLTRLLIPARFDWKSKSASVAPTAELLNNHLFCKHFGVPDCGIVEQPFVL